MSSEVDQTTSTKGLKFLSGSAQPEGAEPFVSHYPMMWGSTNRIR